VPTKSINATFTESEFEQLKDRKGNRKWNEAILEEFGVQE